MARNIALIPTYFLGALLTAFGVNWLGMWRWRRATTAHWTERARLFWPARVSAGANILLFPLYCGVVQFAMDHGFSIWCVAAAIVAWAGTILATYSINREIFPKSTFRRWLRLVVILWSLRLLRSAIWITSIFAMPAKFDWRCAGIAAAVLGFHFLLFKGFGRACLAKGGLIEPASQRLTLIVNRTAEKLNVPMPLVWQADLLAANAMALPVTRELIFTNSLMEICDDEEISAICAHELAHLTESKGTVALRIIGSLSLFPLLFVLPALNVFGMVGGLVPFLLWLAAVVELRLLARRMEKRADNVAMKEQSMAGVYARALEKLYRYNQAPAVMPTNRKAHPHLYDRLLDAGIVPDFPRPKAPDGVTAVSFAVWIMMGISLGILFANSGF